MHSVARLALHPHIANIQVCVSPPTDAFMMPPIIKLLPAYC